MFIRVKDTGQYRYLQVVENHREGRRTVQRVLCTLGRADELIASGATDALLRSLAPDCIGAITSGSWTDTRVGALRLEPSGSWGPTWCLAGCGERWG